MVGSSRESAHRVHGLLAHVIALEVTRWSWRELGESKGFTKDEIYRMEQEFWELYRMQGTFFILDMFVQKGKRGKDFIMGLCISTARYKIRWAEEITFNFGERDEDVFKKSKFFNEEMPKIISLGCGIKFRFANHTHVLTCHGYGDTKMKLDRTFYPEMPDLIITPKEKIYKNHEADISKENMNANKGRKYDFKLKDEELTTCRPIYIYNGILIPNSTVTIFCTLLRDYMPSFQFF